MNVSEIERLVELVQKANISELTLRNEGTRITIRKTPEGVITGADLVPFEHADHEVVDYSIGSETVDREVELPMEPETVMVYSPLVGHFRHIKPMVGLGAKVAKGQVVGVIEAVKLINEITSPEQGTVIDVLVEDGQAVEYGQELFAIQPDH